MSKKIVSEREEILINPSDEQDEIPPYPEAPGAKGSTDSSIDAPALTPEDSPDADAPTAAPVDVDVQQLSYDLVDAAGRIWKVVQPKVREFTPTEIKNIASPLTKVIIKHDLTKYIPKLSYLDEFWLIYNTFNVVTPRLKELKQQKQMDTPDGLNA